MFLSTTKQGYTRDGEQFAHGQFLILLDKNVLGGKPTEYRAIVRHVRMSQFGAWMMGSINVCGVKVTLSGSYGSDGLSVGADPNPKYNEADKCAALETMWRSAVPVPAELIEEWNKGGGHNSCGSEADSMRTWAKTLKPVTLSKKAFDAIRSEFALVCSK